jgi:hypothetical protein
MLTIIDLKYLPNSAAKTRWQYLKHATKARGKRWRELRINFWPAAKLVKSWYGGHFQFGGRSVKVPRLFSIFFRSTLLQQGWGGGWVSSSSPIPLRTFPAWLFYGDISTHLEFHPEGWGSKGNSGWWDIVRTFSQLALFDESTTFHPQGTLINRTSGSSLRLLLVLLGSCKLRIIHISD